MLKKFPKKIIAGITSSVVISIVMISVLRIPLDEIVKISPPVLIISLLLSTIRLLCQGLRFHVFVNGLANVRMKFLDSVFIRGASEFLALSTLPYFSDEVARVAWLMYRGVPLGHAFWIAYLEMYMDAVVASCISIAASINAYMTGNIIIFLIVFCINMSILTATTIFVVAAYTGKLRILSKLFHSIERVIGPEHSRKIFGRLEEQLLKMSVLAKGSFKWSNPYIILKALVLTLLVMVLPAIILNIILIDESISIDVLGSLYAFHAGDTLGLLPITVGGSGLTEAGVYLYLSSILLIYSWSSVIQWRLVTYHFQLILTGMIAVIVSIKGYLKT